MMQQLTEQLKRHEGLRLKPYRCTAGKLSIGFGRNLDDKGINEGEAETMLWRDVAEARALLERHSGFLRLDEVRQAVLINMCFNLGISRLMQFQKMWRAISYEDWEQAAAEMLDSRWAKQVGDRATELAAQMKSGEWSEVKHD
ncbi:Lysozyme [Pseudodesulfovibrio profundus]|uniref:Lysozyme n=1 Tax=Pseudodesulfovibrio profundus TaxID=57320 RepID=A0A2C8FDT2_9BACT|nr:glycoside hydrolase family protein [Pseudodesulfovibrio profundus]SOB60621.1 Lysozyme [Pseudodesulfovibrio profundus]